MLPFTESPLMIPMLLLAEETSPVWHRVMLIIQPSRGYIPLRRQKLMRVRLPTRLLLPEPIQMERLLPMRILTHKTLPGIQV